MVGNGRVMRDKSSALWYDEVGGGVGAGVQVQREHYGGESLPSTDDKSIGQLHHTAFCALKHKDSSQKQAFKLWRAECRSRLVWG